MKKWRIGTAFALAVVALVGSTTAYAAGYGGGHHGWYASNPRAVSVTALSRPGSCWVDADGDGVADTWNGPCVDEDGDGICDLCGRTGYRYMDADGDGICDNWAGENGDGVCDLCGRTGYGYVDADGNGICDNYGTGWAGGGHGVGSHCRW